MPSFVRVANEAELARRRVSQRKRKLVEEPFGWGKVVGLIAKTMLRGIDRVGAQFTLTMAAYDSPDCRDCSPPEPQPMR